LAQGSFINFTARAGTFAPPPQSLLTFAEFLDNGRAGATAPN